MFYGAGARSWSGRSLKKKRKRGTKGVSQGPFIGWSLAYSVELLSAVGQSPFPLNLLYPILFTLLFTFSLRLVPNVFKLFLFAAQYPSIGLT